MPSLPALRHRNFRLFLFGQFVSLIGSWVQTVALSWLVLQLTDSAFAVGLVSAAGALPVLLFTLHGGAMADRIRKRPALVVLQTLMMLQSFALAILTFGSHLTLPWILVLAFVSGLLSAYEIPVRQSFFVDLVGKEDLMGAIALNSSAFSLSRVAGPALAGIVLAAFGSAWAFFLNGVSFLAVLAGLLAIRLSAEADAPKTAAGHKPPISEGLRYILQPGWPRTLITLITVLTIFGLSFVTMLPVYARDVLGTGATGYGGLMSAFGIGAAAGALTLAAVGARLRRGEIALRVGGLAGLSLLGIAVAPDFPLAFLVLLVGGTAFATAAIITNTILQSDAPDALRGRIMGFYSLIVVGLAPIGSPLAGWVSERLGVRGWAALAGTVCLVAVALLSRHARRFARTIAQVP